MEKRSSPLGPFVALAGASLVLASLWLPWYEVRMPDAIREAFRGFGAAATPGTSSSSGQDNPFGKLFEGLAAVIPDSVAVSGWQGMEQGDVTLALLASLVLLVALGAGGVLGSSVRVDNDLGGRLIALMGAVCLAVAGYHVITRPGDEFPGATDYVTLRHGVWIALAGSILMIAGGIIGTSAQRAATGTWTAGLPAGTPTPATPAPAADAHPTNGWISPAPIEPEAAAASTAPAPTPALTATPAGSTAPPGFAS